MYSLTRTKHDCTLVQFTFNWTTTVTGQRHRTVGFLGANHRQGRLQTPWSLSVVTRLSQYTPPTFIFSVPFEGGLNKTCVESVWYKPRYTGATVRKLYFVFSIDGNTHPVIYSGTFPPFASSSVHENGGLDCGLQGEPSTRDGGKPWAFSFPPFMGHLFVPSVLRPSLF